jgi:hypothetical protein
VLWIVYKEQIMMIKEIYLDEYNWYLNFTNTLLIIWFL